MSLAALAFIALSQVDAVPGARIQRTMTLLATSTPQRRNRVRVLFYGQSITQGDWWKSVADDLRRRFPHADLVIENRAIGGFASDLLHRTVEYDVPPFYPDLVIFHDYGGEPDYEKLIRTIRSTTTAEVLVQDDFETTILKGDEPDHVKNRQAWHDQHSDWLRKLSDQYGLEFLPTRDPWKAMVRATGLTSKDLTTDGTHPNPKGNEFMASLFPPRLVHRPELSDAGWRDLVKTAPARWQRGRVKADVVGNRIDLVMDPRTKMTGKVRVLVDGRPPSTFEGAYAMTRPSIAYGAWFPMTVRIGSRTRPLIEEWKMTVLEVAPDGKRFRFRVEGTQTGADGEGWSDQDFVSTSGRIALQAKDWTIDYARAVSGQTLPVGHTMTWRVLPMFRDEVEVTPSKDPSSDHAITVAQGVPNGPHTLELISANGKRVGVSAVRVYRPPLRP